MNQATPPADPASTTTKDETKPVAGAPEAYAEFKVPEGTTLDPAVAKEAGDLFKGMNLNQEQAQSLVDFYAAKTKEAAEAPYKAMATMRQEMQAAVKADPEIGPKMAEVKINIDRALDTIGDPALKAEFKAAMDLTGAGDNLAFIKVLNKLASQVTEGKAVTTGNPSPFGQRAPGAAPVSAAKAMYPNLP